MSAIVRRDPTVFLTLISAIASVLMPASQAVAAEGRSADGLEEIVVTARRREESLQRVPDSIAAFDSRVIERAGIRNMIDVAELTPNLSFMHDQEIGVFTMTIRGVSQLRLGEPPVAFVVDGVTAPNSTLLTQDLFDVERIEVLRGPQGALYGRNSIGGAINIVTKEPTDAYEGELNAAAGNGNYYRAAASFSGPLAGDRARFRLSGFYEDFDGLIDNVTRDKEVDFKESKALRGKLLFDISDSLTADVRLSWADLDGGAMYEMPTSESFLNPDTPLRRVESDLVGRSGVSYRDATLKLDWKNSLGTLTSITQVGRSDSPMNGDVDKTRAGFLAAAIVDESDYWTQELRLASGDDQRIRWLVGGFFQNQERDRRVDIFFNVNPDVFDIDAPQYVRVNSNPQELRSDAYAAFAQVNASLTDALELTVAGRWDSFDREDKVPGLERTFTDFQPKITFAYTFASDIMGYATYSEGFRPGGFNATDTFGRTYDSERLKNYELGFKTAFLGHKVVLNGAAFYIDYDDQQIFIFEIDGSQSIFNGRNSKIVGGELELQTRPVSALLIAAGIGLSDGELEDIGNPAVFPASPETLNGNTLKATPEYTAVISAEYELPLSAGMTLVPRVDVSRTGKTYWEVSNRASRDPYTLVNARLALNGERWTLTAYGENLFDETYDVWFFEKEYTGLPNDIAWPNPPRQYGLEFRYRF